MKRYIAILLACILMIGSLAGCSGKNASKDTEDPSKTTTEDQKELKKVEIHKPSAFSQTGEPEEGETVAIIHIKDQGDICMKFFYEDSPLAVENFVTLAANGYYNGTTFHRVIKDFMIQGGDPDGTGTGGTSMWGTYFKNEYSDRLAHINGSVAMARTQELDTNGSQFFINNNDEITWTETYLKAYEVPSEWWDAYKNYGGNPHLQDLYTVFGQVYAGLDVLDAISTVETDDTDKPVNDVVIESIEITQYSK